MSKLYDDAVADLGDAYRETITVGREVFVKTLQYAVANKEIIFGNIVAASLGRWIPGTLAKYLASLIMSSLPVNERLPYLKEMTEDELRTQLIIANAIPDDHSAAPPGGGEWRL